MKRKAWAVRGVVAVVLVTATGGVVAMSGATQATPTAQELPPTTARVVRGKLSAMVSLDGTLTYRARSDGAPYSVINQAQGTYTKLPGDGDRVDCGEVVYRVDDQPVLLLCGTVPAYRELKLGDVGEDVRQLNRNLHALGYGVDLDRDDNQFTLNTAKALEVLQRDKGFVLTGMLSSDDAVFLPESVRIAKVTGELGGPARPGTPVLTATSDALHVQVDLQASRQGQLKAGDAARITLPGNRSVTGKVDRLGRVAQLPPGQNARATNATIPAFISLDDPEQASGLDRAPVRVEVTTEGVENALSVPVVALVGKSGGGFAVEVVRADGRRELVGARLGLFDTMAGRVQVDGELREGDLVVVPSP